tara:strand:- start:525 stop:1598 length:1074 start_codon:yes stop_codon:yes gene_type:complete
MISLLISLTKKNIYIFILILIPCFIFSNKSFALANNFLVKDLEISEEFNLNFSKDKVIEKAFSIGFKNLLFTILTSQDLFKVKNVNINEIKQLVENFKIKDEKFQDDKYIAYFDINFNKKKIFNFLENKGLFISIPTKIDVFFLPIIIKNNEILIFNENLFYTLWLKNIKSNYLINYILPLEDIVELENYISKTENIESLNMLNISKKYNLENYIFSLFYINNNKINVFSKIKFKDNFTSTKSTFDNVYFDNEQLINSYIKNLKISFEDIWKKSNEINTSIKLTLQIVLETNDFNKISQFEEVVNKIDLISSFKIKKFTVDKNIYEIYYSGNPNSLIKKFSNFNIPLIYDGEKWIIK